MIQAKIAWTIWYIPSTSDSQLTRFSVIVRAKDASEAIWKAASLLSARDGEDSPTVVAVIRGYELDPQQNWLKSLINDQETVS